ncbi:MAG TPA: Ig-like domain-containing protein [Clostridia bacterium]|nr:Ig-like domain-containing protein [Clostridia bacterium]
MNSLRKLLALLLIAVLACPPLNALAVGGEGTQSDPKINLYPGHVDLAKGASLKLYAYTTPDNPNAAFAWETSDASIVDVGQDGTITANSPGEATIAVSLRQASDQNAACTVSVREEGITLLYHTMPSDPPIVPDGPEGPSGDPGSEDDGSGDDSQQADPDGQEALSDEGGEIPVEYDASIPVEVIPSIDEFIWTIKIDDTYDWQSTQGSLVLHVLNRLQLTAVKKGGKTPFGEYQCKGGLQVDYPEADIDAYIAPEGGSAKSQFNPTNVLNDFVCSVKPINPGALYPNPEDAELRTILRDNYTGMASGEIVLSATGGGSVTLTDKDGTVTGTHKMNLSATFPYRLRILKNGTVYFSYVTKAKENNTFRFKGKLYKTPIVPK